MHTIWWPSFLAWTARDAGSSPAWHYTFHLYLIHSQRKQLLIIHISELRMFSLEDDGRPSDTCACALSQK